jgi:tRNA threonylcarbamoyladenosine modification (KEOPS) complex  Pcc1 subunit
MSDDYHDARAAVRSATDYILRWVEIANETHGVDIVYSLVFTTLWAGNVSHLRGRVYSEINDIPPDEERRPITIRQVADSLGLPYETVRRRVVEMIERGVVKKIGREGFIVPGEVHARPENLSALKRSHASLLRFLKELKVLGIDAT